MLLGFYCPLGIPNTYELSTGITLARLVTDRFMERISMPEDCTSSATNEIPC